MAWLDLTEYQKRIYNENIKKDMPRIQKNEINNFIALFCFKTEEEQIKMKGIK